MAKNTSPTYRRQKRKNGNDLAFVELNGQRVWLGVYDSPESRQKYHAVVAEWEASGRQLPVDPDEITIIELADRFWQHAETYYRKPDGTPTSEQDNFRQALRPLKELYPTLPAAEFSPKKLKAVRQKMVDRKWARTLVNKQVNRIRHVFKWGVENELVPAPTLYALQAVSPLRKGRSEAKEKDPVKPVPEDHVDAVKLHVAPTIATMIELQRLTGMRPAEVCAIRGVDIDTSSGTVWVYKPPQHKTQHHEISREIFIGPQGQKLIQKYLKPDTQAPLFSPRHAHAEIRRQGAGGGRRSNQKPNPKKTSRTMGDEYDVCAYRRAIHRGGDKAGVPRWSPNRLRHNAATRLRREYGIDLAQTILGHQLGSSITEIYAEANVAKAKDVIAKVG